MPPKPKYLIEDVDRHGNVRRYVRRRGFPKIRIWPEPDTKEFWAAYAAALEGKETRKPGVPEPIIRAKDGTFRWLCTQYFAAAEFKRLDESTKVVRRRVLEACCLEPVEPDSKILMADCPISRFEKKHARMLRDRKVDVPEAANSRLKALRALFKWTLSDDELVKRHHLNGSPITDVQGFRTGSTGHHTWTIEEVAQFERHHPEGSTARRALDLLLLTGTRKSDVILLGRQHVSEEIDPETGLVESWLKFTIFKNRNRKPKHLQLPVLSKLKNQVIDTTPANQLTFLLNDYGRPFTSAGFGNRMRKWCNAAKLPHCSSHGLRKAGSCIAAENGATEAQLMAIFGWDDPKTAAIYTKKARQKHLASESMHMIEAKRKNSK